MRIILRNWHLKLSAVLLATVLYTGLVFSGSFTDSSVQVRVEQANVSRDVFVLGSEPGVVDVTFRVSNNDAGSVTADDFVVSVDISAYDLERAPEPQQLPLEWRSLKDGVEILSVVPDEVRVEVDRIEVRSVSVEVDRGTIPEGIEIDEPVVSAETVQVRGPASVVSLVDRAVAAVEIPASGINVNEPVPLTLVDIAGQPVGAGQLEVDPEIVSVQIEVACGRDRDDGRGASEHRDRRARSRLRARGDRGGSGVRDDRRPAGGARGDHLRHHGADQHRRGSRRTRRSRSSYSSPKTSAWPMASRRRSP